MNKFKVGDIVILVADPWRETGTTSPFNIVNSMWNRIITSKLVTVKNNCGPKTYGNYHSNDTISLIFGNHDSDNYIFPAEFFSLRVSDLFAEKDFLL